MFKKQSFSLASRLMFFSAVSVLIAIYIVGLLFTVVLRSRFNDYLVLEQESMKKELVSVLTQKLTSDTSLDPGWLEQFSNVYMERGMFFSLNSEEGETLWSCMEDNTEMCNILLGENHLDLILSDPSDGEQLDTVSYLISGSSTGLNTQLEIYTFPPGLNSGNERFFIIETYKMLLLSMVISMLVSAGSSVFFSRSLSRPLISLAGYSERMAGHDYSASDPFRKGTKEVDNLHSAIRQLAHSLESQEELRKRLTADVAHELRTPLTTLQTYMEAMIDGVWETDNGRLNDCHREIMRMSGLIGKLDDLHSYDTRSRELDKSSFDPVKSIEEVFRLFVKELREKQISWDVSSSAAKIFADENKLKQIWINLISNSLKFLKPGGEINVRVEGNSPVKIMFEDNGTGIDSEDLPNIFERFYKADSARNRKGSGLGLSIVKEIVDLHNGSISVESIRNQSTLFTINFPSDDS